MTAHAWPKAPLKDAASPASFTLAYHAVPREESDYLYDVSSRRFEEHLGYFLGLAGKSGNFESPLITFDDGHRSQIENALPLLGTARSKAIFFVVPGLAGKSNAAMGWAQIKSLMREGHSVQSHSWSHRALTLCSDEELEHELRHSREELECRLGERVTSISVPGGRWDRRVTRFCAVAGYETLFHSDPWSRVRRLDGVTVRGRLMVTNRMTGRTIAEYSRNKYLARLIRRADRKLKEAIRTMMGDQRYHLLWRKLARFEAEDGIELNTSAGGSEPS